MAKTITGLGPVRSDRTRARTRPRAQVVAGRKLDGEPQVGIPLYAEDGAPSFLPLITIFDAVLTDNFLPALTIHDATLSDDEIIYPALSIANAILSGGSDPVGFLSRSPTSLSFGDVLVGDEDTLIVTITNTGDLDVAVTDVSITGTAYDFTDTYVGPLEPDDSFTVSVTFEPATAGAKSGTLTVTSDAANSPLTVALSGTGTTGEEPVFPMRLHTAGRQILDENNDPIRLRSVNWFGAEGGNHIVHGLWARNMEEMLDEIKAWGFNCIRVPLSGDNANPAAEALIINPLFNPGLVGMTAIEVLDAFIAYCGEIGLYVVLDHHRRTAGAGADGSPISIGYTEANWHASWEFFATRYASNKVVIGADLHNEPHDLTWSAWADLAEGCAAVIHAIVPEWLIFVEGVGVHEGDNYWWGGNLKGVATRPIVLGVANRLVYSPHEYGQSVGSQPWLDFEWTSVPGYPGNLNAVWTEFWGFIFEDNIAPIWIGEFGGKFGRDGTGATGSVQNGAEEAAWVTQLGAYLNGDFDGLGGASDLSVGELGMSYAYWGYPPISGDTGGLLCDDWFTPQTYKLSLIAPLLEA